MHLFLCLRWVISVSFAKDTHLRCGFPLFILFPIYTPPIYAYHVFYVESIRHGFLCWGCAPVSQVNVPFLVLVCHSFFFFYNIKFVNLFPWIYSCIHSASTDGRIFIWKINEGPDEEDKPQITGNVIAAIQILGESESVHPRVCWHPHKQVTLIS